MTSSLAASLLLTGVVLGAIYLMMALGLTLVYGVTRVFNFAQGSAYIWAGYIAYVLYNSFQLDYRLVIAITLGSTFGLGLLFERAIIYPLRRFADWRWSAVIVTLGCALFLDSVALAIFGVWPRPLPRMAEGIFRYGNVSLTHHDLVTVLTAVAIIIILNLFLKKVRTGVAMQGVAQSEMGANIVGIPINRMYGYSFAIAALLAGVSALLLMPRLPLFPAMGWLVFVKAFIVLMFGGLGSIKGAVIAAFVLGIIEAFAISALGAVWSLPVSLIVLVIVLVFRPKGLFGIW